MKPETTKKLLKLNYDLYEDQALAWDKTRSEIWEKTVTDFISEIKPNSLILDLGCGNGRLYQKISNFKFQISNLKPEINIIKYVGIDPSKKLIEINKEKYPQADFKVGDGLTLKDKNKFDYVFCLAVLHHIPSEKLQFKFLKNIYNSLKKDGQLILSVWNRWQPRYADYMLDKKLYEDMKKTDTIVPWRQTNKFRYINCFTKETLSDLSQKTGFKNIKTFYANKEKTTTNKKGLNIYLICNK